MIDLQITPGPYIDRALCVVPPDYDIRPWLAEVLHYTDWWVERTDWRAVNDRLVITRVTLFRIKNP